LAVTENRAVASPVASESGRNRSSTRPGLPLPSALRVGGGHGSVRLRLVLLRAESGPLAGIRRQRRRPAGDASCMPRIDVLRALHPGLDETAVPSLTPTPWMIPASAATGAASGESRASRQAAARVTASCFCAPPWRTAARRLWRLPGFPGPHAPRTRSPRRSARSWASSSRSHGGTRSWRASADESACAPACGSTPRPPPSLLPTPGKQRPATPRGRPDRGQDRTPRAGCPGRGPAVHQHRHPDHRPGPLLRWLFAKLNLAGCLADHGERVRILTVDPVGPLPPSWPRTVETYSGLSVSSTGSRWCSVASRRASTSAYRIASSQRPGRTAHVAQDAVRQLDGECFLYLSEEYEPFTFPMGTYAALASESYTFSHFVLSQPSCCGTTSAAARSVYAAGAAAGDKASAAFQNAITAVDPPSASELAGTPPDVQAPLLRTATAARIAQHVRAGPDGPRPCGAGRDIRAGMGAPRDRKWSPNSAG
jgi:hypothetical protein